MAEQLQPSYKVLLVDNEQFMLNSFTVLLRSAGIENIALCPDSREVLPVLSRQSVAVIILSLDMPYISGEELLEQITCDFPGVQVIVVTEPDDMETVARCMKKGAFDFIGKPVERNRLVTTVKRTLEFKKLELENTNLKSHLYPGYKVPSSPLLVFSHTLPTIKEAAELLVREALERTNGNQSMAAELLGVTRQALNKRVKQMKSKESK